MEGASGSGQVATAASSAATSGQLGRTPAEHADIRVGDLIVAIDDVPVAESSEIILELSDKDGRTFPVQVIRDGRARTIEIREDISLALDGCVVETDAGVLDVGLETQLSALFEGVDR